MEKKGSITVFLALILSILLSLVSASLQSVQAAATRTQILKWNGYRTVLFVWAV